MAATALEKSSRQMEAVLSSTHSSSDSTDGSSPKLYVKSGKPSSRLRQSQSTSNLRPRSEGTTSMGAFGQGGQSNLTADTYSSMFASNSLHTLNSCSSVPQNPATTPRFTLYPTSGSTTSGGNAPPPPPPSISSARVPVAHSPILHTLQKQTV
uniref:SORBS2 n=1 Tax=Steinernema glaseri TaxID=37863 RepID=A0A1I7YWM2_9BILA